MASSKDSEQQKRKKKTWLWIFLLLLLILVFLTFGILISRLYDYAPIDSNTVFLVDETPELTASDEEQIWSTETKINLFKSSYTNEDGKINIQSKNEDKIIAPGTYNIYNFNLKNTGNIPVDYALDLDAFLLINNELQSLSSFPIVARIKSNDSVYLLGNENYWASLQALNEFLDEQTLSENHYANYTLEWKWNFNGNNNIDTKYGTMALNNDISLTIKIKTNTKVAEDYESNTTNKPVFNEIKDNDSKGKGFCPWILIIILIISLTLIYIVVKKLLKKEDK